MCMLSMVMDYHRKLEPDYWTPNRFNDLMDFVKKTEEYDEKTGQKDCVDPDKAKLIVDIEKLLKDKYGLKPKTVLKCCFISEQGVGCTEDADWRVSEVYDGERESLPMHPACPEHLGEILWNAKKFIVYPILEEN